MLARQSDEQVPRLLSMRKDGLKSVALNGRQGCCLRAGRVQEELSCSVPQTFGREVQGPVSMLEATRTHLSHVRSWKQRQALGICNKQKPVNQLS